MKWYYQINGGHTHVRVFMNGAKCGDLCFRNEEFEQILQAEGHLANWTVDKEHLVTFIKGAAALKGDKTHD
jgi:hypothetical protein